MKAKTVSILTFGLCVLFAAYLSAEGTSQPGVRVLGSLSDKYEAVTFDHAKHVQMSDGCVACHHHGNGNTSSYQECHGLNPSVFRNSVINSFMPCSNCHGAFDRENAAMPGLKVAYHVKCFACHRGMGNVGTDPRGCAELCHVKKK